MLGQGGFGITYLARDTNLNREVAVKEYFPASFATRAADHSVAPLSAEQHDHFTWGLRRFIDEGQTLARFDHPAIVRVLSVFEANGTAYMVMRYEHGRPLSRVLEEAETLSEEQARAIALHLVDGLCLVHEAGFIHRDIKPANVYLREDGSPVLLDFGSARQALGSLTQTLTTMVSPGYAPYEQYLSDAGQQGPWTDIYALAATLYRAVCGVTPIAAVDRGKAILHGAGDYLVAARELAARRYSEAFLAAIDHALAFREADRPQDLASWRAELLGEVTVAMPESTETMLATRIERSEAPTVRLEDGAPGEAPPMRIDGTAPAETPPKPRRSWAIVGIIGALLIGAGALLVAGRMWLPPGDGGETTARVTPRADVEEDHVSARVESLLSGAEEDIAALRLTSPRENNAYEKYQAVLALDPANAEAREGIGRIAIRYLELAQESAQRQDWNEMFSFLKKARTVDPDNERIARAESRLRSLLSKRTRRPDERGDD
jgi:serine/threonine protein kinase